MIVFAPIRARRLDVRLQELSIGGEIALCHLPEQAHEKALSEFLRLAVENAAAASPRHVTDPRAWTVGERLLVLAHYCSHAREDGPDYAVTDVSKLTDYLDFERDFPAQPSRFAAIGDQWALQPLTGGMTEAIETLQIDSTLIGREHWMIGVMAAQCLREHEAAHPDPVLESAAYVAWLAQRMAAIRELPSSSMQELYGQYRVAQERDAQFFRIWFDEQGVIVLPKEAGALTPPARFLVHAGLGELALALTGKT